MSESACILDGWLICQVSWTTPPRVEPGEVDRVPRDQREAVAEWLVEQMRRRGHRVGVDAALRMIFGGHKR